MNNLWIICVLFLLILHRTHAYEVEVGKYLTIPVNCTITSLSEGPLYSYSSSGLGTRMSVGNFSNRIVYFGNITEGTDNFSCNETGVITIDVYNPCPLLRPYNQWGRIQPIPTPEVSIVYSRGNFVFNMSTSYVRGIRYYQGFQTVNSPHSCDNLNGALDFTSAPHAQFPSAFSYPVYNYKRWQIDAPTCDRINIHSSFTTVEMAACAGITVTKPPGTPFVMYEGTYRSEALTSPTSNLGRWDKKFRYSFNVYANSILGIDYTRDVTILITNMYLDTKFHLHLRTTVASGKYLVASSNADLEIVTVPPQSDIQDWHYRSIDDATFLNRTFRLEWILQPDNRILPTDIDIDLKSLPDVDETYAFSSTLETYRDATFTTPFMGPFTTSQRIYLLTRLQDFGAFTVRISNAWICTTSDDEFVPDYRPEEGKYGCSQPVLTKMDSSDIYPLISDTNIIASEFNVQKHTVSIPNAAGMSIGSLPIIQGSKIFYLHIEMEIQLNIGEITQSIKRVLLSKTNNGHAMSAIYVVPESPPDMTGVIVGTVVGVTTLLAFLTLFSAFVIFMIVTSFSLYRIYRQRKEMKTTMSVYQENLTNEDEDYDISDFESLLLHPKGVQDYMEFCKKIHSTDNLLFWMATYNYHLIHDIHEQAEVARNIYNRYIASSGSLQVNLPSNIREDIRTRIFSAEIDKDLFDAAISEILLLMKTSSYPQFVSSRT